MGCGPLAGAARPARRAAAVPGPGPSPSGDPAGGSARPLGGGAPARAPVLRREPPPPAAQRGPGADAARRGTIRRLMEERPVHLTRNGIRKLEEELDELVNNRRCEVAERIRHAREFGDITENAEYTEAKNEQSLVEGRIQTLEAMIRNAVLIEDAPREVGVVAVGAKVTVTTEDGEESYAIVGAAEADPLKGRISNESPLGRALMGHRAGEEVEWTSLERALKR